MVKRRNTELDYRLGDMMARYTEDAEGRVRLLLFPEDCLFSSIAEKMATLASPWCRSSLRRTRPAMATPGATRCATGRAPRACASGLGAEAGMRPRRCYSIQLLAGADFAVPAGGRRRQAAGTPPAVPLELGGPSADPDTGGAAARTLLGLDAVRCERFGQVGSMPVDHYFLFLAVEDVENHVFWGAHIAHLPSWQMKIYRRYENLAVRGGLADLKFGNWKKNVAPGERFHTSEAILPIAYTKRLDDRC